MRTQNTGQYVDTGENVGVLVEHETLPVAGSVAILVIIGAALFSVTVGVIALAPYRRKR